MNGSDLIDVCKQIYIETNGIYARYRQQLGANDFGFKILYGPPHVNAPLLFIGDQPGGKVADEKPNERFGWPSKCEYATETWTLARNMQSMFGAGFLADCVGVNANFFRAPDSESWNAVPVSVRDALKKFCSVKLATMISLMAPKQIVTIGFSVLDKFCRSDPILFGTKQRVLMRLGRFGRWPAVSTLHLSGAQISREDRIAITNTVLQLTQQGSIPAAQHEGAVTPRKPSSPYALNQSADRNPDKRKGALVDNPPIKSARNGAGALRTVQVNGIGPKDTMHLIVSLQHFGLNDDIYKKYLHHRKHSINDMRRYASKYPDLRYKPDRENIRLHQKLEWMLRLCREEKVPPDSAGEVEKLAKETKKEGWSPYAAG